MPKPAPTKQDAPYAPRLSVLQISKRFGAIHALRGVSLDILPGQILALCGENGAGKSTLVKILTGVVQPDSGQLIVAGQARSLRSPRDAQAAGIALVSQELSVCPDLSVLDNIWLGNVTVPLLHRQAALRRRARDTLDTLGLHVDLDVLAGTLTLGQRQLVEIARMLLRDAQVLILDEPTATLTDVEIDSIFAALDALRREGRAVVLVTHRLAEVFRVCDRVAVMRNGELVAEQSAASLDRPRLIELMLGRPLASVYSRSPPSPGDVCLHATNLRLDGVFGPIDLTLRRRSVVALVGQLGAGANEVVRALAGLEADATGAVTIDDVPMSLGSARVALARNLMFVTGDRADEGIFQQLSVRDNLTATRVSHYTRLGWLRRGALTRCAAGLAGDVGIDASRLRSPASNLSGGNQQKIAFGRCLARGAAGVLAMVEPTRGIDIGARADIYRMMREFCASGHALLVASTDLEEVMGIADVIITLYRGRRVAEYDAAEVTMQQVVADITHPVGEPA